MTTITLPKPTERYSRLKVLWVKMTWLLEHDVEKYDMAMPSVACVARNGVIAHEEDAEYEV